MYYEGNNQVVYVDACRLQKVGILRLLNNCSPYKFSELADFRRELEEVV
jgi:hypothetical protein